MMYYSFKEFIRSKKIITSTLIGALIILGLGTLGISISANQIHYFNDQSFAYKFALSHDILSQISNLLCILLSGVSLYKMHVHFSISGTKSYLPFYFLTLLSTTHFGMQFFSFGSIVLLVFTVLLFILFNSFHRERTEEPAFLLGFLIAGLSLLWSSAIFYIPCLLIGIALMGNLHFKVIVAYLIGIVAPFWLEFVYHFSSGEVNQTLVRFQEVVKINTIFEIEYSTLNINDKLLFLHGIAIIVLGLLTSFFVIQKGIFAKMQSQSILYFFITLNSYASILLLIDLSHWFGHISILNIAQSSLLTYYFIKSQSKFIIGRFIGVTLFLISIFIYSLWIS